MAIDSGLDQKFQEFLEKNKVFDKFEVELTVHDLDFEKLKIRKELAVLPLIFELAGEMAEILPEDKRVGLEPPRYNPEEKLSEATIGQIGEFVLKVASLLGDEKVAEVIVSSVKVVSGNLVNNYKTKTERA